ncbi:MAG: chemotaxis protein CheW [Bacillota bacterium]|jgi:purine-binding chemotaxis protein CheW|nr:chemotaxis protein CheW [Bacillota bacterium]
MKNENTIQMQEVVPWLIFKLKKTLYTVNSKFITSIVIKPDDVTFVPNVADHIIGLIHLRGNVIPLIDLKLLLNTESESISNSTDYSKEIRPMVVVLEKDNSFMGLVVDEVLSIENIIAYEGSTEVKQMCNNGFITGVAKGHKSEEVLLVIDEEKIMSNA